MNIQERYESAKAMYQAIGVDTDAAIETLEKVKIAMHCWQGDDVLGFDSEGGFKRYWEVYRVYFTICIGLFRNETHR